MSKHRDSQTTADLLRMIAAMRAENHDLRRLLAEADEKKMPHDHAADIALLRRKTLEFGEIAHLATLKKIECEAWFQDAMRWWRSAQRYARRVSRHAAEVNS